MPAELKLYYSSGTPLTDVFLKDPSDSIGGVITDVEVVGGLNNLFRAISAKALSDGLVEYRIIYLKNVGDVGLTALDFYHKIPLVTATLDPALLAPPPADGDEYIVPENAQGDWVGQDGKKATYILSSTSWEFEFASFATYEFGFISPIDIDLNETTLVNSFVETLETVFEPPFGVTFSTADDVDGTTTTQIGDGTLATDGQVAMVIKRIVAKQKLSNDLYECPDEDTFFEESAVIDEQDEKIIFSYDDGV